MKECMFCKDVEKDPAAFQILEYDESTRPVFVTSGDEWFVALNLKCSECGRKKTIHMKQIWFVSNEDE